MGNPFNIRKGDLVKLTAPITVVEPTMNDGSTINLSQGWTSKFIGFTDDGKFAELVYMQNPDISVRIPKECIAPANSENA